MANTSMGSGDNLLHCDSCLMQVKSLDEPFSLIGNWLFNREDLQENKNINLDTSQWKLTKAPGSWANAYKDHKPSRIGWYRGVFEFEPSLIGEEVVFLLDAYMGQVTFYLDEEEIFKRPKNQNIEKYFSIQPIPITFKVTKIKHVVAFRVDSPLMAGVYQLPFKIKKFDPRDISIAWYQFWGGEIRTIVAYVVLFFGLFFLLVYYKTRFPLYFVAAASCIVGFPFFAAPGDSLVRFFAPDTLLYLHYTGIFSFYMSSIFAQYFNKYTPKMNWILGISFFIATVAIGSHGLWPNMNVFPILRRAYVLTGFACGISCIYHSLKGAMARRPGSRIMLFAAIVITLAGAHDNFLSAGMIHSVSLLFSGTVLYTTAMLFVTSNIFANAYIENKKFADDLQKMHNNLENIVTERTEQLGQKNQNLQAMLTNMPQGVMTLVDGNIIHSEYSKYLESLLETDEIAGRNIMDVVFAKSNLGVDALAQLNGAIDACLGQGKLNFDFNAHLLPTECQLKFPKNKIKHLDLIWSPICDQDETIEKMMVCIRDVTDLKALAIEANKQKRELQIIGQILEVKQDQFHSFIENSSKLLEDCKSVTVDSIPSLTRNLHTLKGNARTLGLLHLTNKVHEVESLLLTEIHYQKIDSEPVSSENLLTEIKDEIRAIEELIFEYDNINEIKLGRRPDADSSNDEKFFKAEKALVHKALVEVNNADFNNSLELERTVAEVKLLLNTIGAARIGDVLSSTVERLGPLAIEAGKCKPEVLIIDNGILIQNHGISTLKNIFHHLLRNSVDHGLETENHRLRNEKKPTGQIQILLSRQGAKYQDNKDQGDQYKGESKGDEYQIKVKDDGQGLDMKEIRKQAIQLELCSQHKPLLDTELAQMIFSSRLSTSKRVTDVSGRGMGLDSVKKLVEGAGGAIKIHLFDFNEGAEFRPFEIHISLPPQLFVSTTTAEG